MNFKSAALCAFAAVALLAGCERKPEGPPPSPDEITTNYSQDMQTTLTAYFNTHKLKKEDIQPGFTVPWVSSKQSYEGHGFMVATGETSPKGCPVWKVSKFDHEGDFTSRYNATLAMCP
jgi:hypothetical protein